MKLPSFGSRRRGGSRSVAGCLTCRRRRVKCTVQISPCDNCCRLKLTCTSSFHVNFKNWTPEVATITTPGRSVKGPTSSLAENESPSVVSEGSSKGANVEPRLELPQDVLFWLSDGLNSSHLETPNAMFATPFSANVSMLPDTSSIWTEDTGFTEDHFTNSQQFDSSMWSICPQISQVYGNSHGTMPFLHSYERAMPNLLTSKSSPWNPYNYMLKSTETTPNSPLRHSILSWSCSYISCREKNPAYSSSTYYVSASTSVSQLIPELSKLATNWDLLSLAWIRGKKAEKLYQLLATAFFLSHCDLMLCDYRSFHERLDSIKLLFEEHWQELKACLGTLERRLLIWLAYLDLRSSLFRSHNTVKGQELSKKSLLNALVDLKAFPSLRKVTKGHSYLSHCFGDNYPNTEVQEDLIQEPCHVKCDEVLSILGNIKAFEVWNDTYLGLENLDQVLEELREAKIQDLRASIARIRAECTLLFTTNTQPNRTIDRTTFHALTVTALHLCTTILLNRILSPHLLTDLESQSAATQIIHISHRLRKVKYLESPRSLIWPMPIFIAGIETTDEVHREWVLDYLRELGGWGQSVRRTRGLLERIVDLQGRLGRRVRVGDFMEDWVII